MIDKDFELLFIEIEKFLDLCLKVPQKLSEYGLAYPVSEEEKDFWKLQLPAETHPRYQALKKYVSQGLSYKKEIDEELSYFRQLPRYISEGPCYWSAYYPKIRLQLKKMHILLIDIDTKYKLGQHKNDP